MAKKLIYGLVFALAIGVLALGLALNFGVSGVSFASDFKSAGRAAYMIDSASGAVLYQKNENQRLPIASMMKIMTATLTLEAVERGDISLEDDVTISKNAASMGGSQVFLQEGQTHKVKDLLKTVIVASANDSCVALAEHVSGSVEEFVRLMNDKAKALGMSNTNFKNCTGLPAPESFSSAKDVAKMFGELIKHPIYFDYAKIWLEDYKHPDGRITTITNTNKLVRFYNGCDGGKTGFTSEAKFCLAATAKRGDMRIIAVVIGVDSAKERNAAVSAMFDYAFNGFSNEVFFRGGEALEQTLSIAGGKEDRLRLTVSRDITSFMAKGDKSEFEVKFEIPSSVKAPVKAGDVVGKAYLTKNGVVQSETDVLALDSVERMSIFDAIKDIAKKWGV